MGFERLPEWTVDGMQTRLVQLRTFFPECVTEGPQGLAVPRGGQQFRLLQHVCSLLRKARRTGSRAPGKMVLVDQ